MDVRTGIIPPLRGLQSARARRATYDINDPIEREMLALTAENLRSTLVLNVVSAIGVALVLESFGSKWGWIWLAGKLSLAAMRHVHARRMSRATIMRADGKTLTKWRKGLVAGFDASSLAWVAVALIALTAAPTGSQAVALLLLLLAAAGTGTLAPLPITGRNYILAKLVPGSLLLFAPDLSGLVLLALSTVYILVMLAVHNRNHQILRSGIKLSIENGALIRDLCALNADLESQVEDRTKEVIHAANTDNLTGLPNRRRLLDWMEANLALENEGEAAALFLDLDRFKEINDALGHDAGDLVLQEAVARLEAALPEGAILGRWGGDEFIVVLPHGTAAARAAAELGTAMIAAIGKPFDLNGQTVTPGLSVGYATFPSHARTKRDLLTAADLAVNEAKRTGRGRVVGFKPALAHEQNRHYSLSRELSDGLAAGDFSLDYQPIIDRKTGQVTAFEALARWTHPELGEIAPSEFIPIAEESRLILDLGDWVLRTACGEIAKWDRDDFAPSLAVNVSVRQLASEDFAMRVQQILVQSGLAPGRLELEVTEGIFAVGSDAVTHANIESLRALGVSLAIDDFGTGYSSLSRLVSLPVSTVKIDRSFVAAMDGIGGPVIESTLLIAQRLGLRVIAEGIETVQRAERLSELGIDLVQGYYYGFPSPAIWQSPPRAKEAEEHRRTG